MRRLILRISVSVDGVLESTAAKIDFAKTRSPDGAAKLAERMAQCGAHLLGRKAFCEMAPFWATATNVLAKPMNEIPKIVFSKKGFDPATVSSAKSWAEAKVLTGDLAGEIRKLKEQPGKDLIAHGGVEFAQNLVQTGLIDEFWLTTHPIAAGKGTRLFEKLSQPMYLKLIESAQTNTGTMMNVYRPE